LIDSIDRVRVPINVPSLLAYLVSFPSTEIKRNVGRESQFLHILLPIDAPVSLGDPRLNIAMGGHWAVTFGTARRAAAPLMQSPPRCTKCNSSPINGQCTNHHIAVYDSQLVCGFLQKKTKMVGLP